MVAGPTVAALVTAVGGGLLGASVRDRVTPELVAIAAGCAAGLAGIDVVYVVSRRISPVYLGDAAVQLAVLAGLAHQDAPAHTDGAERRVRLGYELTMPRRLTTASSEPILVPLVGFAAGRGA